MIELSEITKSFGSQRVLDAVSLKIPQGEILGFIGPNGAGKTTTMKILTGYLMPDQGAVKINSQDIWTDPVRFKGMIGYLPENAPLYYEMRVIDYIRFMAAARTIPPNLASKRINYVIEICHLSSVLGKMISNLSRGYRQRVGLAQAIIHDPEILILDEPTAGLDPNQIAEVRDLLKAFGREKTIVYSTHILQEVPAICHRVVVIHEGRIIADGTPADLMKQTKVSLHLKVKAKDAAIVSGLTEMFKGTNALNSQTVDDNAAIYRFDIETDPENTSLVDKIIDLVYQHQGKILELKEDTATLEEAFRKLTMGPEKVL